MRKINKAGLELLEKCEGFSSTAYKDQRGVWTIGIGHTGNVQPGTFITEDAAITLLSHDLEWAAEVVEKSVLVPLTENQFSALVCFVFNIGAGAFRASTLLKELNRCHYSRAADLLLEWDHVNGKEISGLKKRREAERTLFLT